jgi:hypothetical protein
VGHVCRSKSRSQPRGTSQNSRDINCNIDCDNTIWDNWSTKIPNFHAVLQQLCTLLMKASNESQVQYTLRW